MRDPKTIKGYISLMRQVEMIIPYMLKGHDELPQNDKDILDDLSCSISNVFNEFGKWNKPGDSYRGVFDPVDRSFKRGKDE